MNDATQIKDYQIEGMRLEAIECDDRITISVCERAQGLVPVRPHTMTVHEARCWLADRVRAIYPGPVQEA
jgi:hypothetical protein